MNNNDLYPQEHLLKFIQQQIEDISLGFFVLNRKTGQIVLCNDEFTKIFGFESSQELLN
ncbi:MAG: PAS domain-containing protein, partial [Candidatus Hodarchaeales archaeon]